MNKKITTLFCDLGGVLLTNGWDHKSRKKAAELFGYNFDEAETNHKLLFGDYEIGEISLDEYLHYVIFNEPRKFSPQEYKEFMYKQSRPLEGMLPLIKDLREKHGLKIVIVSNEGRDLTDYRITTFGLKEYVDIFIVSCYAKMKKPDKGIFRLAMDVSQSRPENIIYLEDRELFVQIARDLGIESIRHTDLATTVSRLRELL